MRIRLTIDIERTRRADQAVDEVHDTQLDALVERADPYPPFGFQRNEDDE